MNKSEKVRSLVLEMVEELGATNQEILTADEVDNGVDALYEAPRYITTCKNGHFHLEYAVMSIDGGVANCIGLAEEYPNEKVVEIEDMSMGTIVHLHEVVFG